MQFDLIMSRLTQSTAVICILGILVAQNVETVRKTNKQLDKANSNERFDKRDEGPDDADFITNFIEKKPLLKIARVTSLKPMRVPPDERSWNLNTVAPEWLIRRMSELQAAVVHLRQSFYMVMKNQAAWSCRWMEVHFPEYFACVTKHYVDLVVDDSKEYPKGLLFTIKNLKELYITSFVNKIPVYKLSPDVWKRTEYSVNGLLTAIEDHRTVLEELVLDKLRSQASSVKMICGLPAGDRHSSEGANNSKSDPLYVFDEDYEPVAYNRL